MNKADERIVPGDIQHSMGDGNQAALPGQEELLIQKKPLGQGSAVELIKSNETNDVLSRSIFESKFLFQSARVLLRRNAIMYGHSDMEGVIQMLMQGLPSVKGKAREQFIEAYKAEASSMIGKGFRNMGRSSPQAGIQS